MIFKRDRVIFAALLLLHLVLLVSIIGDFSISYSEAKIYFENNTILSWITHFSTSLFGQNDYSLRLPFVIFYLASAIIFYRLLDDYFKHPIDRLITIAIFMILPGVNSAALLVNQSIIVIFLTLLYLYLYKIYNKEHYIMLVLFLFIDNSFAILYLALFFYSMKKKDNTLFVISLILFGLSMGIYGFDVFDKPQGYFLDTFAVFASIFSPLLFIYFFYAIYRIGLKWEKDMYWYLSSTALGLALLFSLRQKIDISDFAPFVVIAIPLMVKLFMHSFRVRLKQYRQKHFIFASFVVFILIVNFLVLIFNKTLYPFFENPSHLFTHKYHVAKELADILKVRGITNIVVDDAKLQLRLKFYGINEDEKNILVIKNRKDKDSDIAIKYYEQIVARFDIISINNVSK